MSDVANEGGQATVMGPWGEVRSVPAAIQRMAEERMKATFKANPWLMHVGGAVSAIVRAKVTHKKRLQMLRSLADRVNAAVAPQAACRSGCHECCKIQVEITEWEAKLIGAELGIQVLEPGEAPDSRTRALELMGVPCGFLKDGECSIYSSRPIACRLHHNLSSTAEMCSTDLPPEASMVPALDMSALNLGYATCSGSLTARDMRDFFAEAWPASMKEAVVGAEKSSES